jgi:acyl-CoA dehydrogenase
MEVLAKYGNVDQQERWLKPLLAGKIRSAFLMTEPEVASSDATNIETSIVREGDEYVINGRKWWSSGAMDPRCEIFIVMGKTNPDAQRHVQQSMVLVPKDTPGVTVLRPLHAMGGLDSPGGHAEILLENVRVPVKNLLLGEGRGFEIAQGRLGPGRIHHCMRLIGMAQRSLELMCDRVANRVAFGKALKDFSSIRQDIARSRCDIQQARLLTLEAADKMDKYGHKGAADLIAMIKIVAPQMTQTVVDRAIQAFGGMGVSNDVPLYKFFAWARILRLADGPDEVHMYQLGRTTVRHYTGQTDTSRQH